MERKKKKAGVAILVFHKTDFNKETKKQRRALHNGERINSTRSGNILNIYAPSTGAPRFIKQVLRDLQRDLDSQHFGRPSQKGHLSPEVQDQPGQHGKTPSLLKIQNQN